MALYDLIEWPLDSFADSCRLYVHIIAFDLLHILLSYFVLLSYHFLELPLNTCVFKRTIGQTAGNRCDLRKTCG